MIEEQFPRPRQLVTFKVELVEELGVEGYVQQWPQADDVSLLGGVDIGARRPPLLLVGVDIAPPSTRGADCAPHLLLQARDHSLLGCVGEVDARDVSEAAVDNGLDDVVADAGLVVMKVPT